MSTATRIGDLALIGDLRTGALVDRSGSIVWLCLPDFDSPACFAGLLDTPDAGTWSLRPGGAQTCTARRYHGATLVLETRWETDAGIARVLDFMPPREQAAHVVRVVEGIAGQTTFESNLRPRFDSGRAEPWVRWSGEEISFVAGPDAAWLTSSVPAEIVDATARSRFSVAEGETQALALTYQASHLPRPKTPDAGRALEQTVRFWEDWSSRSTYEGPYGEEVLRSLILLKALTYAPTGGMLAAATTSLPEHIGGSRNWDYRYCWLRDATFTLQALIRCGHLDEARSWREWLLRAVAGHPAQLQIMYGLDGARWLPERELTWLSGFKGSQPVRVGNTASEQRQLDVWGEVLDGLHLARESGLQLDEDAWDLQVRLLDWLEGNWHEPDNGVWEMRGPRRDFVHSKVMAWAGLDRAVRSVENHGLEGPVDQWRATRADIHREVCERGFDAERGTFTQFYGSRGLDAALLLIPRSGFLPWNDTRVRGTVEAVERELTRDGLVWRYDNGAERGSESTDGLPGQEGAFLACCFWLVDARYGIGETGRARDLFERLLRCRNDVGMLSEQYDPQAGEQLGNTPQAFTLVGLVNSAHHLSGGVTTTSSDPRGGAAEGG